MKKLNIFLLGLLFAVVSGCTYTFPEPEVPTSGSADFSKVVVVGNSLSAGFMDGALYDAGQAASYPNIIAGQMTEVGGGAFNQPDIKSPIGNFGYSGAVPLGHLILKNPLKPAPAPIVPGDPFNTSYDGDKAALNNFAVPGMRIVHAEIAGYGLGNPYFGRFASNPNTTTVLADAIAANGSFIIFWLGGNDALGYATNGATGDPNGNGSVGIDMTDATIFAAAYNSAVSKLITDGGKKGILANVPNVSDIPYFTTVPYNAIPMDQQTADGTNALFAGLNGALEGLKNPAFGLDADDLDARKVFYTAGGNPITMHDSKLVDLGPYYDQLVGLGIINSAQRAGLEPYRQSRPMTSDDLVTLTAGAVLGTLADPGNPGSVIGVAVPLEEKYTLTEQDIEDIGNRIAAFNASIKAVADASTNITLLDINTIFADFAATGTSINGSGLDATISPPFGAFSLDGVHPNQRGSAYIASLFIDQINAAFGSDIPNVNPNNYPGNAVPVP